MLCHAYDSMYNDYVPFLDQCDGGGPTCNDGCCSQAVGSVSASLFVDALLMHVYSRGLTVTTSDRWAIHFAHKQNDVDCIRPMYLKRQT